MIQNALKSRTMQFALAIEILGVIQINADFLSTVMTPAQFGWVMLAIGITVKILRTLTTNGLADK